MAVCAYPQEKHPSRASVGGYEEQIRADTLADLEPELAETGITAQPLVVGDVSPARALRHAAEHKHAADRLVREAHSPVVSVPRPATSEASDQPDPTAAAHA